MPHADSSLVPATIKSKTEFWDHVYLQLDGLLSGQRNWVTNLANTSSLVYNALLAFPSHFGQDSRAVNWCGFYLDSTLFPSPIFLGENAANLASNEAGVLLLGPFCGKPACQFINITPEKARGVCADAYLQRKTLLVPEVDRYPGHIACDGDTNSEIVCPLILWRGCEQIILGVLDLDCLAVAGFDEDDKIGLEKIADLVVKSCDW